MNINREWKILGAKSKKAILWSHDDAHPMEDDARAHVEARRGESALVEGDEQALLGCVGLMFGGDAPAEDPVICVEFKDDDRASARVLMDYLVKRVKRGEPLTPTAPTTKS